ncbi:MAG: alpha/beta hydrolase [Burkholderiales bacterium]|nr:alpha/beta hydrolase [Burkholderiales bacterium]
MPITTHHFVAANGLRLHYARSGDAGPPLLFLHGFPEYWAQWQRQLDDLGADHVAVALDQRGYHLSDAPEGIEPYRMPHLVADVLALADHLGWARFTLIGQDWGGAVAWAFAAQHPHRLERLVILNAPHAAVFARELRDNPAQQAASAYMAVFATPEAPALVARDNHARFAQSLFGDGLRDGWATEAERDAYLAVWNDGHTLRAGLAWYAASAAERADRAPRPAVPDDPATSPWRVEVPTLVLWGDADVYLLPGNLDGLDAYVPHLTLRRFPGAPHWLNRSHAADVNAAIRAFVAGAVPRHDA